MNRYRYIIISAALGLALFTAAIFAHGGFQHVQGTVVKVDNNMLTVKTAKGNSVVKLTPATEITKDDHKAGVADLKPDTRVVVDIPEDDKANTAHSVKIGAAPAAPAPAKAAPAKKK